MILKRNNKAIGYFFGLVVYGKLLMLNLYKIDLKIPVFDIYLPLWRSSKKPIFRNVYIISLLWMPIMSIIFILLCLGLVLFFIAQYFWQTLFRESFITGWDERISGYISFCLALLGVWYLIILIF